MKTRRSTCNNSRVFYYLDKDGEYKYRVLDEDKEDDGCEFRVLVHVQVEVERDARVLLLHACPVAATLRSQEGPLPFLCIFFFFAQ